MKKNKPFARRLRQFRFVVKQLNRQIENGLFEQFSESKKQRLFKKLQALFNQLQKVIPTAQLRRNIAKASFVFALASSTTVQAQMFAPPSSSPFGLPSGLYASIPDFVDIDDDGDLDLFYVGYDGGSEEAGFFFAENVGSVTEPQFSDKIVENPFGATFTPGAVIPEFVDIDDDGDYDLLFGRSYDEVTYEYGGFLFYENTGTAQNPAFTEGVDNPFGLTPITTTTVSYPRFVDIDDDGDMDLIVSTYYSNFLFFENNGNANQASFGAPTENPFGIMSPENGYSYFAFHDFADLDDDGDMDLLYAGIIGEYNSGLFYQENTGTASVAAFDALQLNPFGLQPDSTFYLQFPLFVDLDGDGDQDVLSSIYGEYENSYMYFENTTVSSVNSVAEEIQLQISPNPVREVLFVQAELPEPNQDVQIRIVDVNGRLIYQSDQHYFDKQLKFSHNIESHPKGIYFIQINSSDFNGQLRFIKA